MTTGDMQIMLEEQDEKLKGFKDQVTGRNLIQTRAGC